MVLVILAHRLLAAPVRPLPEVRVVPLRLRLLPDQRQRATGSRMRQVGNSPMKMIPAQWEAGITDEAGNQREMFAWANINGNWWAFGADGYIKTGWAQDGKDNRWYQINANTGMKTGWHFDEAGVNTGITWIRSAARC